MISVVKDSIEIDKNKLRIIHLEVKILRQKDRVASFFYFLVLFLFCFIEQHSKPYNRSL